MSEKRKLVDVAVAVIVYEDGKFLLAQRPEGKPYAGYWEFPGGKVELGESVYEALVREIQEELGIQVTHAYPWITQIFSYPHALVKLHFYRVTQWQGEPYPHENQAFSWLYSDAVNVAPLLPANGPVLQALSLPVVYGISNAAELGKEGFLVRLESALKSGLKIVQVREKQMTADELASFAADVVSLGKTYGAKVVVNSDVALAAKVGADGVHLTSQQLMQVEVRPDVGLIGASCHNQEELERAAALNLDYVLFGPVLPTLSHPDNPVLGWATFGEVIKDLPMPVYALGGLEPADLVTAWHYGAHGIAMLRSVWKDSD
ncbi:Nudix family hydrolase [Sulfurirhabdus autotrophica]|uniref:8-oxo-dGTP diphosphatase n=1 Tax=Sulfurirhabdus autotrophica TaxID=1706046 RepID=A0A4R3XUT7_9PROT|nr:Nudix family hydrolase [Sulfurirhabdus autotrophica]TCV83006.1 8-oxo-dGTP diphosphatase [Sulfurirhabdus autotrophica]